MSFFVSCDLLYFKIYFVWYEYCYSCFSVVSIFACNILFSPLTLSLYVSLDLKWVSCRQHIYGSCFWIHSASLFLLVGAFNPFTFNVIMDKYVFIVIYLKKLGGRGLLFWVFFVPFLFLLSCDLLTIFSVTFGLLFPFYVCVHYS